MHVWNVETPMNVMQPLDTSCEEEVLPIDRPNYLKVTRIQQKTNLSDDKEGRVHQIEERKRKEMSGRCYQEDLKLIRSEKTTTKWKKIHQE